MFCLLGFLDSAFGWKTAEGFSMNWAKVQIKTQPLGGSLYLLHGSGANVIASVGKDGILLVDTEFPQMSEKLQSALARLKMASPRYIIDTHWHNDHTGGNAFFAQLGAKIVAQKEVRTRLMTDQILPYFRAKIPASPREAWPTVLFDKSMSLPFNGEDLELIHLTPAHTDGDSLVYFPKSNLIHLGDIYINGLYPIIDLGSGGTIDGYFPTIDAALARCDDETRVIPGHGPLATKRELKFYRNMLKTVRDRVFEQIHQGKTLTQIQALHLSKEFDVNWASDRVGPDDFVRMIYQSLTGTRDTF